MKSPVYQIQIIKTIIVDPEWEENASEIITSVRLDVKKDSLDAVAIGQKAVDAIAAAGDGKIVIELSCGFAGADFPVSNSHEVVEALATISYDFAERQALAAPQKSLSQQLVDAVAKKMELPAFELTAEESEELEGVTTLAAGDFGIIWEGDRGVDSSAVDTYLKIN